MTYPQTASRSLFIVLALIISITTIGCKTCNKKTDPPKEETEEIKVTDDMLKSVEEAINDPGKGERFKYLLQMLKDIRDKKTVDVNAASNSDTPLIYAAQVSDKDVTVVLLKKGADVNKKGRSGETPLIAAAANGNLPVVKELLKAEGIKVNDIDDGGQTALYRAAEWAHKEIVAALLAANANAKIACNNSGFAPSCTPKEIAQHQATSNPAKGPIYQEIITMLTNAENKNNT